MEDSSPAANAIQAADNSNKEQNGGRKDNDAEKIDALTNYTRWLMVFTGVLAGATIVLAISTCFLWYYAGKQSKDMEKSIAVAEDNIALQKNVMVNVQRAYLFIKEIHCTNNISKEKKNLCQFVLLPKIMNYGNTPGINANAIVYNRFFDKFVTDEQITPNFPASAQADQIKAIIGPGVGVSTARIVISPEDAYAVYKKNKRLFIWITIEYNDWFINTPLRHTRYCAEIEITSNPRQPIIDNASCNIFRFKAYGKYNTAD